MRCEQRHFVYIKNQFIYFISDGFSFASNLHFVRGDSSGLQ